MTDFILQARGISKSFASPSGGKIDVLKGLDMSLSPSESVSLTGESGSGKTTFLNICASFERSDEGQVFWEGKRIDNLSNSKQSLLRAKFLGFVFQSYCLVPEINVLENVILSLRIAKNFNSKTKDFAKHLLERVGLKDRMRHLSSQLSGGEKQRVAIARALVNSPRLVLADEPTGNLDEITGEEIMSMFLDLCKNNSVALLLITHNEGFAGRTDRRLHLSKGNFENT